MDRQRVGLAKGEDRRQNVFQAMDLVRVELTSKLRPEVMLKPNFLSSKNPLASTHADAVRGAIDFLLSCPNPPEKILIAEGGNEDRSGEAFDNFGYRTLPDEFNVPIELVDLNLETAWETIDIYLNDRSTNTVHLPQTVLDCPCTISVAVAKTHNVCCVTLAVKNMIMGTIRKQDRSKMHGNPGHGDFNTSDEARCLNINLIRLARRLTPDIGVVDGTVGLQGNGPGGTDQIPLGIAGARESGSEHRCRIASRGDRVGKGSILGSGNAVALQDCTAGLGRGLRGLSGTFLPPLVVTKEEVVAVGGAESWMGEQAAERSGWVCYCKEEVVHC